MSRLVTWYSHAARALARLDGVVLLAVRVTLGAVFVESGWGKLHNLEQVIGFFTDLGIPAPRLQAPFVAGSELVFGALVLAGALTRLAVMPIVIMMVVAIATARRADLGGAGDLFGFIEYLYIALALVLATRGAGPWSADALAGRLALRRGRELRAGEVAAARS